MHVEGLLGARVWWGWHIRGKKLLCGRGGERRVHRGAESVLRRHFPGVEILLGNHHNLRTPDGGGQVSDQFFFVLKPGNCVRAMFG